MDPPASTPGGPAAAVLMCLAPLTFLLLVTVVKSIQLPSRTSLPMTAVLMAVVQLAYLSNPTANVMGTALAGCMQALVLLSVIFGAILLFQVRHQPILLNYSCCYHWPAGARYCAIHGAPLMITTKDALQAFKC